MDTLDAHFDGRAFVPNQPVDYPAGTAMKIHVECLVESPKTDDHPSAAMLEWVEHLPPSKNLPSDGAAQHDHYLYGTPKRP